MKYETTIPISDSTCEYLQMRGLPLPIGEQEIAIEVDYDIEPEDRSVGIFGNSATINEVMAVYGNVKIDVTGDGWLCDVLPSEDDLIKQVVAAAEDAQREAYDAHVDAQYEKWKDEHYFGGQE